MVLGSESVNGVSRGIEWEHPFIPYLRRRTDALMHEEFLRPWMMLHGASQTSQYFVVHDTGFAPVYCATQPTVLIFSSSARSPRIYVLFFVEVVRCSAQNICATSQTRKRRVIPLLNEPQWSRRHFWRYSPQFESKTLNDVHEFVDKGGEQ